jgi:hypothetical protein
MARTKKKVDPFEFPGSDDESDDEDKLSAKRKRRNSGNSTPHSVNGLDDGGGFPCRDEDGGRSTCRAKLCFPGSGNQSDTAASGTGSSEEGIYKTLREFDGAVSWHYTKRTASGCAQADSLRGSSNV